MFSHEWWKCSAKLSWPVTRQANKGQILGMWEGEDPIFSPKIRLHQHWLWRWFLWYLGCQKIRWDWTWCLEWSKRRLGMCCLCFKNCTDHEQQFSKNNCIVCGARRLISLKKAKCSEAQRLNSIAGFPARSNDPPGQKKTEASPSSLQAIDLNDPLSPARSKDPTIWWMDFLALILIQSCLLGSFKCFWVLSFHQQRCLQEPTFLTQADLPDAILPLQLTLIKSGQSGPLYSATSKKIHQHGIRTKTSVTKLWV